MRFMKRFIFIIFIFLISINCASFAFDEISLDSENHLFDSNYNILVNNTQTQYSIKENYNYSDTEVKNTSSQLPQTPESQNLFFKNIITKTAQDIYHLEINRTDIPSSLLKNQLTKHFDKGPFEELYLWTATQTTFNETIIRHGANHFLYNVGVMNVFLDGKFRGGKDGFRIMINTLPRKNHTYMQTFFSDLFVYTDRIPHHRILLGNSRVGVGKEGTNSAYTTPFVLRSQISRNLSNIRKFGLRIKGDYKLVDYDIGGYSSDTYFHTFFPGAEFNGWIDFKPLGMTDGKYGKLSIGGGISGGRNNVNYFVSGAAISYEYKRFRTMFECMSGNGSNSLVGPTTTKANGFYIMAGYKLTKKLEFLMRYDQYNPNKKIAHNKQREYTAGLTYYIKGQALRLMLNYIYCQNEALKDSHRILLGTQFII